MASTVLRETLLSSQLLVQIYVLTILQHHIDVLGIVEIAMQLHDIGMIQSPLNLEFSLHLGEKVEFFEHLFIDDFEGNRNASGSLHSLENFAKLAASNGLNPCKIMLIPALPLLLLRIYSRLRNFLLLRIVAILCSDRQVCLFHHIILTLLYMFVDVEKVKLINFMNLI